MAAPTQTTAERKQDASVLDLPDTFVPPAAPEPAAEPTRREAVTDGPRLVFRKASSIKPRRVHWLWDTTAEGEAPTTQGRIPMNALTLAAGGAGLGKSQFAVWLCARVTTGTLPGALYGKPRSVVYCATEDSWAMTIVPRLIAAGADLDRIFHVEAQEGDGRSLRLSLPQHTELVGQAAEENDVALMVCDPLLSMLDGSVNDYKAAEVRAALEPLIAQADLRRFTILGLAHFTKSGGTDVLTRVAGSGAFGQLIRALIAFERTENEDGGTEFVLSQEKNNLGRLGMPAFNYAIQSVTVDTEEGPSYVSRLVLGGQTSQTVSQVLKDREAGLTGGTRGEVQEWLAGWLSESGGHATRPQIMTAAKKEGHSESTINRAKNDLKLVTERGGFKEPATWWLPEQWGAPRPA